MKRKTYIHPLIDLCEMEVDDMLHSSLKVESKTGNRIQLSKKNNLNGPFFDYDEDEENDNY